MALKYKLDADTFGSLEDGVKANYRQEGNVYILDVDGFDGGDDVAGLKAKVETLLTEKKETERKAEALAKEKADEARQEEQEKHKKNGDFEQLYKSQQEETERVRTELAALQTSVTTQTVNAEAQRVAATLTKDTARAGLLTEKIASRLKHTDEGIKVLDATGNLTVSTIEDLTGSIKSDFPFLVDGSQSSGGAAPGSRGGAGGSQKEVSRADFDSMDHFSRSEHVKAGGTIIDD